MKPYTLILNLLLITYVSSTAQNIYFKDGVLVGKTSELIADCIEGAKNKNPESQEILLDYSKYCSCLIEEVYPKFTSDEFLRSQEYGDMAKLMLRDDVFAVLEDCVPSAAQLQSDYTYEKFNRADRYELQLKTGVKSCINEMMTAPETKGIFTQEFVEKYCTCIISRLLEAGIQYGELFDLDETSKVNTTILEPCAEKVFQNY